MVFTRSNQPPWPESFTRAGRGGWSYIGRSLRPQPPTLRNSNPWLNWGCEVFIGLIVKSPPCCTCTCICTLLVSFFEKHPKPSQTINIKTSCSSCDYTNYRLSLFISPFPLRWGIVRSQCASSSRPAKKVFPKPLVTNRLKMRLLTSVIMEPVLINSLWFGVACLMNRLPSGRQKRISRNLAPSKGGHSD